MLRFERSSVGQTVAAAVAPFLRQMSEAVKVAHSGQQQNSDKKSPYHKDTGVPDLLLPRCAHGITSDWRDKEGFPEGAFIG